MRTLRDKLSHLSFLQASKLLGPQGQALIMEGGKFDINLYEQVDLNDHRFRLTLGKAVVEIRLSNDKYQRFNLRCSRCTGACVHQGAALSLILEEKFSLGLSAPLARNPFVHTEGLISEVYPNVAKDGEISNRSWIAPLVHSRNKTMIQLSPTPTAICEISPTTSVWGKRAFYKKKPCGPWPRITRSGNWNRHWRF